MKSGAEAGGPKIKTNLRHLVSSGGYTARQTDRRKGRERAREKERERLVGISVFLCLCTTYVSSPQAGSHSGALAAL